ncbi:crotonobetainyl-CoA:carnitine CoA-transferase CaiB-like acyl-CoA transferase [Tamaricihabitans halophyticus]|uniref:Crotonobetainyl-CoA:carnitine CoA-transferase CaiB-like acyl-CoA transferase n=1 Tax=Tamaricihabitans halophyticus TaxID=1262583 RepID=A0A4R2QGK3_9PSEU|nr:CoA transferase [Tamaricihabitans halophyticus]TCP47829.1 crotonobetainyl-CoA:carnitine CoA-transferase CaiB-like acyl-CoA transferase [Tamaricihabitans halophyticus]
MQSSSPAGPGYPLDGVRVVELCHVAAGPFAAMLLADLGADVVKVESPSGDGMRQWPPRDTADDGAAFSYNFASVNRNKRSVLADLKQDADRAMVAELISNSDVVIENYRPGVLDRLGLGFAEVSARHRGLVYCSISGFGLHGPYVERGAFDVVIQGMSGLMSVTGEPGGDPVKSGVPVGDFVAGLYAAYTTAALLPQVRETGVSRHVDCAMLDCLLATSALQTSEYWGTGRAPTARGSAHPRNAPYQAFRASDGTFTLAAGNDRLWQEVCKATEKTELVDDPRFTDQAARAVHQDELVEILAKEFATKPVAHWVAEFGRRGVPCGPINSFADILDDPHVEMRGLVRSVPTPVIGSMPTVVFPVQVSGLPSRVDRGAPVLGEHTAEVVRDWGQ